MDIVEAVDYFQSIFWPVVEPITNLKVMEWVSLDLKHVYF